MGYKKYWRISLVVLLVGLLALGTAMTAFGTTPQVDWNQKNGIYSEDCTKTGDGRDPATGWIHWVWNQIDGDTANARLYLGGSGSGDYAPSKTTYGTVHFMTPYFPIFDAEGNVSLTASVKSDGAVYGKLVISDYCQGGATLRASVEAEGVWTEYYEWDIDKSVFPARWDLFKGDTGKSTYVVDVTLVEASEESYIEGEACVENIGSAAAQGVTMTVSVYDEDMELLDSETFDIGELIPGAKACEEFSFDLDFEEGKEYLVAVTVNYTGGTPVYTSATVEPELEVDGYPEITVVDTYAGELGTISSSYTFTYDRTFGCDSHVGDEYADDMDEYWKYNNTAEIVETEQSDDAYVDVYCYELGITKTAVTTFEREHLWDIDKKVETENGHTVGDDIAKVWLYTDGSGDETATWTVDVTYEGSVDSGWAVSGTITITNPAPIPATINSVTDWITHFGSVDIGWDGEPFTIAANGGTKTFNYSTALPNGKSRVNYAKAIQQNFDYYFEKDDDVLVLKADESGTTNYKARKAFSFGDPDVETNKTVNIQDISDLFGTKNLGTVTAPYGDTFTYDKDFAYADYDECGSFQYDNTATIVETEQSASATLKVNVQCYKYESAWAKGVGEGVKAYSFCDNGFNNWGWSNYIQAGYEGEWPLWAGAGQCDTSKGTHVGNVIIGYAEGKVTVDFDIFEGYDEEVDSEAVFVGHEMFPRLRNRRFTTAPGQYTNTPYAKGTWVYVIAHINAGVPDPNFGP